MGLRRPALALGILAGVAAGAVQAAGDFTVDVSTFVYQYGAVTHALDFAASGDFDPALPEDPATGWGLIWEPLNRDPAHPELGGAASWTGSVWRMSVAQATIGNPESVKAGGSIGGLGGFPPPDGPPPPDWRVTANISAIAGADVPGTLYEIELGGGTFDPSGPNVHLNAHWFSGEFQGVAYTNALILSSDLSINGYSWDSGPDPDVLLTGVDPATTHLDLMVDITGSGQTFSSYYRFAGDPQWHSVHSHTLPAGVGALTGFDDTHPYIAISNEIAAVPEPQTWALLGVGLACAGWVARRRM